MCVFFFFCLAVYLVGVRCVCVHCENCFPEILYPFVDDACLVIWLILEIVHYFSVTVRVSCECKNVCVCCTVVKCVHSRRLIEQCISAKRAHKLLFFVCCVLSGLLTLFLYTHVKCCRHLFFEKIRKKFSSSNDSLLITGSTRTIRIKIFNQKIETQKVRWVNNFQDGCL